MTMQQWVYRVRLRLACAIAGPLFYREYLGGDEGTYRRGYLDGMEFAQRRMPDGGRSL